MSSMPQSSLEIEDIGDVTVVRWDEQPQWPTLAGDHLFRLAEGSRQRKLLVNFARVDSLASMVLAKLMTLNKKVKARGGVLALCNVSPRIREVFEITRVNEFFQFYDGEKEALQVLANIRLGEPKG